MHRWMTTQFFLFYFSWTTFISYWGVIFDERGFAGEEIGWSITVSLVTRAIAVVTLFPLANRFLPIGTIDRILPWLSFVLAMLFLPHTGFTGLLVISALFGLLYPTVMPVLETTAALGSQRRALVYGPARVWGSIGFVVGAAVNGAVAQLLGNGALLYLFVLALLALAVTALTPIGDAEVAAQRSRGMGSWAPLLRPGVFVLVLGVTVLVQSSHAAYYAFGTLHLVRQGAAPWVLAVFLMLAPLAEMLVFRLAGGLVDRWPLYRLLGICVAAAVLRWLLWTVDLPLPVLVGTQVFHALTFGLMQLTFVQALRRHVPSALVAPAQGLYSAIGTGVGTAVLTAMAGAVFDVSPAAAFALTAGAAVLATPLLLLLRRRERAETGEASTAMA